MGIVTGTLLILPYVTSFLRHEERPLKGHEGMSKEIEKESLVQSPLALCDFVVLFELD